MVRFIPWSTFLFVGLMLQAGCSLGPWGGPAYTIDWGKIGSGEQAIVPRNDSSYSNGEPTNYRSRR